MSLSKKFCSGMAVCLVSTLMANSASAVLVALTENVNADYFKSPDASIATFAGAITPTFAATDDTYVTTNPAANYNKTLGDNLQFSTSSNFIKFDLSAIPTGATINEARIQLFSRSGNTGAAGTSIGKIVTKTWNEDDASKAGPDVISPNFGWGPLGTGSSGGALFDYAVDVPSTSNFIIKTVPAFTEDGITYPFPSYLTTDDIKVDVQDFLDNTNFGWGFVSGNRAPYQSTPAASGIDNTYPILFVDYTVAVPEPSSFLMLSALAVGLGLSRKRKS